MHSWGWSVRGVCDVFEGHGLCPPVGNRKHYPNHLETGHSKNATDCSCWLSARPLHVFAGVSQDLQLQFSSIKCAVLCMLLSTSFIHPPSSTCLEFVAGTSAHPVPTKPGKWNLLGAVARSYANGGMENPWRVQWEWVFNLQGYSSRYVPDTTPKTIAQPDCRKIALFSFFAIYATFCTTMPYTQFTFLSKLRTLLPLFYPFSRQNLHMRQSISLNTSSLPRHRDQDKNLCGAARR